VWFKSIEISRFELKQIITYKNIRNYSVFGFYAPEDGGFWSSGLRSCLALSFSDCRSNHIDLTLDAHPFIEAFRSCKVLIKTSSGHSGKAIINGKGAISVKLKRPILSRRQRLVVGDFSKIQSPMNQSLCSQTPLISIIIINHERALLSCLAALAAASSDIKYPFEILCCDNGSSLGSVTCLKKSEVHMRVVEFPENLGFGYSNNQAAIKARGQYLLFLNNDAFLSKGAVDEMLKAFQNTPDCRIVGSVLKYPDGTMQEAGATLQPDGHPLRHGRNEPNFKPRKLPRFQAVGYVSGACMMIRKSEFLEMDGFDEKYSPAYYEDTDLCMRSLLYGQKVYLSTRANCYHIENATTSTIEGGAWATRTAEAHREIFLKDWGAYLASRDLRDLPHHLKR